MTYAYRVVDVFTERRFEGNPLAVLPRADGLDDAAMQQIAREFNLSETVFVLPPSSARAVARLRIFTPRQELRFAGHPTIGTAHVLLSSGVAHGDAFAVEERVGDVAIRVERRAGEATLLWLTTPPVELGATVDGARCAGALALDPGELAPLPARYAGAGSRFLYVPLASCEAVDRAVYEPARLGIDDAVGVFVFALDHRVGALPGVYARMFAPGSGIAEDPATGSAAGPLAAYLGAHRALPPAALRRFVVEQGTKMGRRSLLHVAVDDPAAETPRIEVGGSTVDVASGEIEAGDRSAR